MAEQYASADVEAVASTLYADRHPDRALPGPDDAEGATWRGHARAVLDALTAAGWLAPHRRATRAQADEVIAKLRAQHAEEIAEAIEAAGRDPNLNLSWMYPDDAARIARQHAANREDNRG